MDSRLMAECWWPAVVRGRRREGGDGATDGAQQFLSQWKLLCKVGPQRILTGCGQAGKVAR